MYNERQLFTAFNTAVNWNAIGYIGYKTLFTLHTMLLYHYLPTNDFALLANIHSTIFLALLWLDCGMRKTLPRYLPEWAAAPNYTSIVRTILIAQTTILLLATPAIIYAISYITKTLGTPQTSLITVAALLFITEGIITVIRLVYHTHFLNKPFNLANTVAMTTQTLITGFMLCSMRYAITPTQLITVKLLTNILFITYTIRNLNLHESHHANTHTQTEQTTNIRAFITHSAAMWASTSIKSLSERNFLVPFITYTLGPAAGSLFKVANDSALFFYRIILKTIGTTDTTLLAHGVGEQNKIRMQDAFRVLTTKVTRLCFPVLGIGLILSLYWRIWYVNNSTVFHLFIIMFVGYIAETMLLPYERVLEVKRRYGLLALCYAPYALMLVTLLTGIIIPCIGLCGTITLIHSVRLVSVILMSYMVRRIYGLTYY